MTFIGDRPLGAHGTDRLGFGPLSKRIATSLMAKSSEGGIVIGIEGAWGSGKTSLIDLTMRHLPPLDTDKTGPAIVNFKPWLIGDRNALLSSLFKELAAAVDSIAAADGDAGATSVAKTKELAEKLRNFSSKLGGVGSVISAFGSVIPGLDIAGKAVSALSEAASDAKPEKPLAFVKDDLVRSLNRLNRRIIVTVDDVDRLEPLEALEVLRLVRSVGDFPNVIYLLCYDKDVLSNLITEAINVRDGCAFLEKIVQASVRVPAPEEFRLRNWFQQELESFARPKSSEESQRLIDVIMTDGDLWLKTPRSVVKVLDELRFYWPAVNEEGGDLADLVWLSLVKSGCIDLYNWIEDYCSIMSVVSHGIGRATDLDRERFFGVFVEFSDAAGMNDNYRRAHFAEHLLGVESNYAKNQPLLNIFQSYGTQERDQAIAQKRLKSPDHHRLYFALELPSYSLKQADFDEFWRKTESNDEILSDLFVQWARFPIAGNITKCEMIIDRLSSAPPEQFSKNTAEKLISVFGDCMDELYSITKTEDAIRPDLWSKAEKLFVILRDRIPDKYRSEFFVKHFEGARALGWLSYLFRREVFAHGVFGNERTEKSEWYFSEALFLRILKVMKTRYRSSSLEQLMALPRAQNVFHTWRQSGDVDGPKDLIAAATVNDERLIDILEILASAISTSEATFTVIRKNAVENLIDFGKTVERIRTLAESEGNLRERAKRLLRAIELAREF